VGGGTGRKRFDLDPSNGSPSSAFLNASLHELRSHAIYPEQKTARRKGKYADCVETKSPDEERSVPN
jgi:hypothetical protein